MLQIVKFMDISWVALQIPLHIMNQLDKLELEYKLEYLCWMNSMIQKYQKLKSAYMNHYMKMA